ncbi:polygalacturonase-like [Hibiscus syriacus]|uniref:polygalacturonase-like n=1 Tax=Hibiscus syriacus TaxID=106335 RepID=UPI001924A0F1|nr:polygalacturonase-like [Hibiscus syriacus]
MASTLKILLFVLLIQSAILTESSRHSKSKKKKIDVHIFNVVDFGATGDGTMMILRALCKHGMLLANPQLRHQCAKYCNSNNITFQIDGNIVAPSKPSAWQCIPDCDHWISFRKFDGLSIQGYGIINGQGSKWWTISCKDENKNCPSRKPTGLVIADSNNVKINGLTFEDSPQVHIALERYTLVHATKLTITAPKTSPNTDGIHIQHSTNVSIHNSNIQTGDDCISIGNGSKYINITKIECGPGHGISIGSLGINGRTDEVEYVHVKNVTFHKTTNGVKIKTWQTSNVEISNVTYKDIHGTSSRKIAVELSCSESIPCKNIIMKDISLSYKDDNAHTSCLNAHGFKNGSVEPDVPCLQKHDNL